MGGGWRVDEMSKAETAAKEDIGSIFTICGDLPLWHEDAVDPNPGTNPVGGISS